LVGWEGRKRIYSCGAQEKAPVNCLELLQVLPAHT
jgi:hypothetical protein